jgi:hypothetical protein
VVTPQPHTWLVQQLNAWTGAFNVATSGGRGAGYGAADHAHTDLSVGVIVPESGPGLQEGSSKAYNTIGCPGQSQAPAS